MTALPPHQQATLRNITIKVMQSTFMSRTPMQQNKGAARCLQTLINSQGSLTAHLEYLAGRPLRVVVTAEGWQALTYDVRHTLGIARPCMGWVREVKLYGCDDAPWVHATSVFSVRALTGEARRLKSLKCTPIGYVLYKRQRTLPKVRRFFETAEGYGRCNIYDWQGRQLMIEEIFLPALVRHLAKHACAVECSLR